METMHYRLPGGGTVRVGYRTPTLSGSLDAAGKMALAGELGMPVVEPQLVEREFPDEAAVEAYAAAAKGAGIAVETAGAFPALTDPAARDRQDAEIEKTIRRVERLGARYVFVCVQEPPEGVSQPDAWPLLVQNVQRWADGLNAAGVSLAIEPEWFVGSVERMARLVRLVDRPNLCVNYDPTNFYLYGSDPLDALAQFPDRIRSGHIKDGVYRAGSHTETPVGTGELDYAAIFTEVGRRGLSLTMHIEHCTEADQVRAAAAHVRAVMREVGASVAGQGGPVRRTAQKGAPGSGPKACRRPGRPLP